MSAPRPAACRRQAEGRTSGGVVLRGGARACFAHCQWVPAVLDEHLDGPEVHAQGRDVQRRVPVLSNHPTNGGGSGLFLSDDDFHVAAARRVQQSRARAFAAAFTSAPADSRSSIACSLPIPEARWSGVFKF